ncbi:MAG: deoxyribodipyrimidine photo-lyase [Verrucomicrobiae bacterium]|nr:deoxyribodipyrimidine photo-lyase [Verrucomicrobiae bacterium]
MPEARPSCLVWFRLDLRLTDNPALALAAATGGAVVPVFLWSPEEEGRWAAGAASRWWLHHSLTRLDEALRAKGSRLVVRRGPALDVLRALVRETGAGSVFWNRRYEPATIERDRQVKEALGAEGLRVESANGALLHEPWTVRNRAGKPFQVFTPYWRECLGRSDPDMPVGAPGHLPAPRTWPASEGIEALGLLPGIPWDQGLREAWRPGEAGAVERLARFCAGAVLGYGEERNRPDREGTSRLSPHLHFGEIGPRQVWHAVRRAAGNAGVVEAVWRRWQFLAEVGWREFAHHLLFHFPHTVERPLREPFERFPWREDAASLECWQRGRTGYPLVDAGMRELWATGWMHNRVRMVAGSFLVKNLLISWRAGAEWFWDTLVDADLADNTLGWQWVAGCGADAAPYFRVFNPVAQGRKFDPDGGYVRQWIPELRRVPTEWVHAPWEAPPLVLRSAGVRLGTDYPEPRVSATASRLAALDALASLKAGRIGG